MVLGPHLGKSWPNGCWAPEGAGGAGDRKPTRSDVVPVPSGWQKTSCRRKARRLDSRHWLQLPKRKPYPGRGESRCYSLGTWRKISVVCLSLGIPQKARLAGPRLPVRATCAPPGTPTPSLSSCSCPASVSFWAQSCTLYKTECRNQGAMHISNIHSQIQHTNCREERIQPSLQSQARSPQPCPALGAPLCTRCGSHSHLYQDSCPPGQTSACISCIESKAQVRIIALPSRGVTFPWEFRDGDPEPECHQRAHGHSRALSAFCSPVYSLVGQGV